MKNKLTIELVREFVESNSKCELVSDIYLNSKQKLRFDFYIKELNVCIEFQGIQHYKPINYFGGESRYNSQVKKDNIKVNFCNENNIKLIRIPYFEIDNIEKILKSAF